MRRPLDLSIRSTSSCTCARAQDQVGQLVPAVAGDEDPARVVDPDLLDGRVVEERLQRRRSRRPARPARRPPRRGRGTGATAPVRLRSSWSRDDAARRCGVRRRRRAAGRRPRAGPRSRTCASSDSTSSPCASAYVRLMGPPRSREGAAQQPDSVRSRSITLLVGPRPEPTRDLWTTCVCSQPM